MEILYEDSAVTVVLKPVGLISERSAQEDSLAELLARRNGGYVGVIHRLDRGVGGVMVYAKTQAAAKELSLQVQNRTMEKEYLALVHGVPTPACDTLRDLLFHDRIRNKSFVVDRKRQNVKEAILSYQTEKTVTVSPYGTLSLVRVALLTGRTHQIRVQFSHRGHPLLGDGKYGARDACDIGLFCTRICFTHPVTHERLTFSHTPTEGAWELFED